MTDARVPKGNERLGFFKSPDIDMPVSIPVVAGKNIEKARKKERGVTTSTGVTVMGIICWLPRKMEKMAADKMKKMSICVRMANAVEM